MELAETVRIPEERVGELVKGKSEIEESLNVGLEIVGNEVFFSGESLELLKARNMVLAIGRGFSFKEALYLKNDDYCLEVIDIKDFARTKNAEIRLRGRVIGDEGRAKRFIENHTNCLISIFGKTVSIIGKSDEIIIARRAVIMLLEGAKHGSVYHFLEDKSV